MAAPEPSVATSPYPGLRSFESHEADVFFGREEHTDRLLEILQGRHFLAVIGPSGSGKSSLVRAGLLPALAMGSLGSGSQWRVAVMRPGDRPFAALAACLLGPDVLWRELAGGAGRDDTPDDTLVAMLLSELRRGPLGLLQLVQGAWERSAPAAPNLLLVVDQFEELFTYAGAAGPAGDEAEAFVQMLLAARGQSRIHIALTMRTDFLGHCVRFVDLPDAINRAQYLTPRLTRAQMERAILAPAQIFGGEVTTSLVTELINATGQNSDQLPLVQHALSRMWPLALQRDPRAPCIGWDDHHAVGGVQGALGQHAEALMAQAQAALPADAAGLPEAMFRCITARRPGGQDVRQPRSLAWITRACGLAPAEWPVLASVLAHFSADGACLLQHGTGLTPASVIDLSHEALMRQWSRLAGWVADEARRAAEYHRWEERAIDHADGHGSLLTGADLARAVEWWNPDPASAGRVWQPTAAWAARYAAAGDSEAGQRAFERTLAFIASSRAAQLRADELREQAEADSRTLALEREHARDNERSLRRLKRLVVFSGLMLAGALAATGVAWQKSREADQAEAEKQATISAEAARRAQLETETARRAAELATRNESQALDARRTAEELRAQAEASARKATQFAALAAGREKQALAALGESKRQQALAEEQRQRAEQERQRAEEERARAEDERARAQVETARADRVQQQLRVQTAQAVLNSVYASGLALDGVAGMRTFSELRKLQADMGAEPSGRLDTPTWACVQALSLLPEEQRKDAIGTECGPSSAPAPSTTELQIFLKSRGFSTPTDGMFGMVTQAALSSFQTLVGLAARSGKPDRETRDCIARVQALPSDQRGEALRNLCARPPGSQ